MNSSLISIESKLMEFYSPTTPNNRKHEIEIELIHFKNDPNSWRICLQSIRNKLVTFEQNEFLWFFYISTLENIIRRRWTQCNHLDRIMLHETLWGLFTNLSMPPKRQRDTYAKLLSLLAKRQFPDEDPNYIAHCMALIKSKFDLGICLLRFTSEEAVNNNNDVSNECKQHFHSCISMCLPDVMDVLTRCLLISVSHICGKDIYTLPDSLIDPSLLIILRNENSSSSYILELLLCVQHLVSWIPTHLISEYFLMSIFDLSQWNDSHENITLVALSVLNDILLLQKTLPYVDIIMSGMNNLLNQHISMKQQGDVYLDKFSELLKTYVNKCLSNMQQKPNFFDAFLKSLYCSTIFKNGVYDFTEKLNIWVFLIKNLAELNELNQFNVYLNQLVAEIMQRIQFAYNRTELETLNNELILESNQTEWQQYLNNCFDCIALIAESRSNFVFSQVYNHWSRSFSYIQSIENDLNFKEACDLKETLKSQSFSENLRDFATICQALVRIASLIDTNITETIYAITWHLDLLAEHILSTLEFFTSVKFMTLVVNKIIIFTEYEYACIHVLMTLRSILPLSKFLKQDNVLHKICDILGSIFEAKTFKYFSSKIYIVCSHLLLCISSAIRENFLKMKTILNLMHSAPHFSHLPNQVIANIYISIINYLISGRDVVEVEQDYSSRSIMICEYIEYVSQNVLEVDLKQITDTEILSILNFLAIFNTVINFFKDFSNNIKRMLITAFKPIINKALLVYDLIGSNNNNIAISIAEFSLNVLGSLQNQLGSNYIEEIISLFIKISRREQLTKSRLSIIEKIIQMFQLIVEQPGNSSLSMLPAVLDFTFEHVMPLLNHDGHIDSTDLTSIVYGLLDSVLNNKWQYFYKCRVQQTEMLCDNINASSCYIINTSNNLHPEHFMNIMNAFGYVLVSGQDPNLIRIVLNSMQNVNDRWRLYHRPIFITNLLVPFQKAIINILLSDQGDLHFDLLSEALYAMSKVDAIKMRENLFKVTLPLSIKFVDEVCLATDIPTFSQKLMQLVRDAQCVRLIQN